MWWLVWLIIIAGGGVIIVTSWVITCVNIATSQRLWLIKTIPLQAENVVELLNDLSVVSFDAHVRELMWFRDPMNLYSDELLAVVQEKARHHEA